MKCVICCQAGTVPGMTSVLLVRDHLSLTLTDIPAQICPHCGEAYADEAVTVNLLLQAEKMATAGTKVDVCAYEL